MKKVVWLLVLVLSVSVVGCDKENGGTTNNIISYNESSSELTSSSDIVIIPQNPLQRVDAEKDTLQIVETVIQPVLLKDLPSSDYVYDLNNDVTYKLYAAQFPCLDSDYVYFDEYYGGTYSDYESMFIKYLCEEYSGITINDSNHEDMSFTGTQTFFIDDEKTLVYDFKFKLNADIGLFECVYYKLQNDENILSETTAIKQPNVNLLEMKNDPNNYNLVDVFEETINRKFKSENNDLIEVLYYIKGNFINSGYDEYIVFFKQGASYDNYGYEVEEDHIKYTECMVVHNDSVLQSYTISGLYGDIGEIKKFKNKFGTVFFQGWIGDFNKNGINELLVNCYIKNSRDDIMFMIEFCGDHFETYDFLASTDVVYDWQNQVFTYRFAPSKQIHTKQWIQGFSWSEKQRCYIIIYKVREDIEL